MTEAELLVEMVLGTVQEKASGIFLKTLDNGREVYTCKCPGCGTLHGGYRSFADAWANRKCRECFRSEIERTKKDIEKVDEPEKERNIFEKPMKKPVVLGEEKIVYEADEEDLKSMLGGELSSMPPGVVNKWVCVNAHYGQIFWHKATGKRVRVMGRCKTWKTRPDEFRLPVKFGLYQSLYITNDNAGDWTTAGPV